jgi:putative ABC transport system ATP-binding protein
MAMQSFSPESGQISCSTSQPVISARNLNHFYGEGELRKQVLSNIDLDIYPGEIIIMTGPSGSGKTTLLTLMGGLRSAQEAGRLTILGQDLYNASEVKLAHLRRNIGYIFQAHNLLTSLTARQNVRMSLELHERFLDTDMDALAAEMLTAVGLGHRVDYDVQNLSGGQKQRVATPAL